ncbi:hypothetical protein Aduo_015147 [Ancylostoma duodenale]
MAEQMELEPTGRVNEGNEEFREAIEQMQEQLERGQQDQGTDGNSNVDWSAICAGLNAALGSIGRNRDRSHGSGSVPILFTINGVR